MNPEELVIELSYFVDLIQRRTTIKPSSLVEIGSMHGLDTVELSHQFSVPACNVQVLEPHPALFPLVVKAVRGIAFVHQIAASDRDGVATFTMIMPGGGRNPGKSSLLSRDDSQGDGYEQVQVPTLRMDTFMYRYKLAKIDVLKLDVEGFTYEVLDGFGARLKDVGVMHIECEHIPIWNNQRVYADVERLLIQHGFGMLAFRTVWPQSDSVWVQNQFRVPKCYRC